MGGNALKAQGFETRRATAQEYHDVLIPIIAGKIARALPLRRYRVVLAYRNKPDFGDADIVLVSDGLPDNWQERLIRALGSRAYVSNGPVFSLEYDRFQVDLLLQSESNFDFACGYFAWNDLGNLIGRIARRMGFKFGHDGLWYVNRRGDRVIGTLPVTRCFDAALAFLGYDPNRHHAGFDTLEAIYTYAASSIYFDPDSFLLSNRSHKARVRDRKRPSYMGFLDWLRDTRPRPGKTLTHQAQLSRAFVTFPQFRSALQANNDAVFRHDQFKAIFNGHRVSELTGLTGKALGAYMAGVKHKAGGDDALVELVLAAGDRGLPDLLARLAPDNAE